MPIFENNGKKQNVQDAHVEKYMELYPDATTVMERDGKKYRVKAKDYNTFLGDTLEAPKMESAPHTVTAPQVEAEPQQGFLGKVKGGIADVVKAVPQLGADKSAYTFTAEELERMDKPEKPQGTVWGEESIATVKLPEIKPINVHLTDRQLKELREMPEPERNEALESGSFLTDEHKKVREEFDKGLTPIQRMQMKDGSLSALNAPGIPKNLKYDYDFKKEFGYFPSGSDTEFWNFLNTKTGEEYQMKMFGRPLSDYEIAKLSEDARRLGFWGTVGQGFKGLGYGLKGVELELAEGIADLFGVEHAKENINEERERILTAQDNFKPTAEGFGGFVAEMIPQMTGTGLGLLVSAVNPVAGATIVNASTAAQVASSMGSTALEARRAGASDAQTAIAMLLSGGAELLSEKYVNSKYIKRIMPKAADVVAEAGDKALESELNKLLQTARKELGGKFTAKTAKDLVGDMFVEGASEFSAEAVQALIPIIYENKEDYPTIVEVFNAGLEGFKGGIFMGGIFGGTSSLIQNRANNQRRREQGFVDVANVEIGGKPTFVEVLGKDKDGNFVVLNGDETVSIKESQIKERKRFDYNDFRNAEVEYAREIGYEQEPTGENAVKEANEYTNARNEVVKVLSLAEGADVDAMLEGRTAEEIAMGDTEVEDAVNNYIKARARRDGFRERYQEERDRQFAESDRSVDETANDGMVYTTTTPSGEKIIITGGKVVLDNEGYIDVNQSEGLVAMFPDGSRKPVRPGELREKVEVSNAEETKAARRASIEEQWRAEFESAENAYVEQQKRAEGVVFDVTDKEGTHRVEVVKEGDETSNILVDGEQMQISTEMLNALRGEAGVTQAENGNVETENEVQPEVAPGDEVQSAMELTPAQTELPKEKQAVASIPTEKRGKEERAAYHMVPIERTMEDLHDGALEPDEIVGLIDARIKEAESDVKAVEKKKPVIGADKNAYVAAKQQWQADMEAAKAKLDYYNNLKAVNAEVTRSEMREAVEGIEPQVLIEQTADEFVANLLGGWIKITPESFQKETGLKAEQKQMVGVIAGKEKGGVTVEQAAEIILENYGDELRGLGFNGDMQDMRDMIINILSNGNPRSYAKKGAEMRAQESVEQQMSQLESIAIGMGFKDTKEMIEFEEAAVPKIIQDYTGFDEQEYFNNLAENIEYDTTRESEGTRGSSELLQGEQTADNAGVGDIAEPGQGGKVQGDVYSGGENATSQGNQQQVSSPEVPSTGDTTSPVEANAEGRNAPGQSGVQQNESGKQSLAEKVVATAKKKQQARFADHAKGIAEKLGVEVTVHNDESTVTNKDAMTAIAEGGEVKGWYNPNTGEIALFLPAMESMRDVESTILHEAVSHYGIKHFLGKEDFDKFLDGVWDMMPASKRAEFLQYVGADMKNPSKAKMRQAADEYVAHIAEKMDLNELEKSVWQRFIDYVMDVLRKAGFKNLKQRDVEAVIRASYANLRKNGNVKTENGKVSQVTGQGNLLIDDFGENLSEEGIRFSIRTDKEVVANREKQLARSIRNGLLSKSEANDIREASKAMLEIAQVIADAKNGDGTAMFPSFSQWNGMEVMMNANGRPVVSVIKANSEYPMNIDFAKDCIKRDATNRVLNRLAQVAPQMFTSLTSEQLAAINDIIKKHGLSVPCVGCFVEAKRYRSPEYARSVVNVWNTLVDAVEKGDEAIAETKKELGDKVSLNKIVEHLKKNPSDRIKLSESDIVSPKNYSALMIEHPAVPQLLQNTQGQNVAQLVVPEAVYYGDVLKLTGENAWDVDAAYQVGGVRIQSFSDFKSKLFFDYCQVLADLASKRLPAHSYTKVPAFAELFGLTGMKINLSLYFEGTGLDSEGNYTYSSESISPEIAYDLQSREGYTENVGTMAIGVSDEHIWKMMKDENIRSISPYHKSGINPVVANRLKASQFTDYTNEQNAVTPKTERLENESWQDYYGRITERVDGKVPSVGKKVVPDFNLYDDLLETNDPVQTAKNYVEHCQANGIVPKFASFVYNPDGSFNNEYYKLLYDFAVTDMNGEYAPQGAVTWNGASMPANTAEILQSSLSTEEATIAKNQAQTDAVVDDILRELGEKKEDIRFRRANKNQEVFVSNAQRAVEGIKQEKATPEQWIAMLKKNGGLKAGEEAWLGLETWLNEKQGAVTKQEILDFIGENKIQIEEVRYSQFGYGMLDEAAKKLEAETKEIGWDAMQEKYPGIEDFFEYYNGEVLWNTTMASIGEYEDFVLDNKIVYANPTDNAINESRESYTTEGLENKREIALVVPTVEPYNQHDEIHFGDAGNGRAVAWVRFGETTDSEGNRVLVIDEIQSKRHQDGREKGYKSQADKIPATMEELTFGEYNGLTTVSLRGERFFFKSSTSKDEILDIINKRIADGQLGAANSLVPDAPFEKNWHELAMKRMLRLAAEEGFDKVAWTTGEQQAERYNIAKVVSHIECEKVGKNGNKSFSMGLDYKFIVDPNGIVVSSKDEYIGKSIADIVGKPLANKMLEMQEGDTISGDGLRIGGEGMKGFYDRMLPSFVSKYTKKWGAKVGEVTMPNLRENNVMHSVDVTPEMQESVMEGQTMFSKRMPDKDAPIKEHTRTWAERCQEENPKLWNEVVDALKVLPEWGNAVDADARAMELLESLCERENYSRVEKEMKTGIERANGVFEMAERISSWAKVKDALKSFWNWVQRNVFHTEPMDWQDFVDDVVGRYYGVSKVQRLQERIGSLARDVLNAVFKQSGIDIDLAEPVEVEQVAVVETENGELNQRSTPEGAKVKGENQTENGSISSVGTEENGSQAASEPQARNRNMDREAWKKAFKKGGEKAYDLMYELHGGIVSRFPQEFLAYLKGVVGVPSDVANVVEVAHNYLVHDFKNKNPELFKVEDAPAVSDVHSLLATKGYSLLEHTMDNGKAIGVKMMYRDKFVPSGQTDTSYTPEGWHGRTVICYYSDPDSRLHQQYVFTVTKNNATETPTAYELAADPSLMTPEWADYLEKIGRKNEDGSYNLEGLQPDFSDPFSLSHLMIRIGKTSGDVEIISRYNHGAFDANGVYQQIAGQPNATLDGNLNKLASGLYGALADYKNIKPQDVMLAEGVKIANDGKVYRFTRMAGDIYVGDGFWIKDNEAHVVDRNKERMVGDLVVGKDYVYDIRKNIKIPVRKAAVIDGGIEFFTGGEAVTEIREIEVNGEKRKVEKTTWKGGEKTTLKDNVLTTEITDGELLTNVARMARPDEIVATDIKEVGDGFLSRLAPLERVEMPNLERVGDDAFSRTRVAVYNFPKLREVGDGFLPGCTSYFGMKFPSLEKVGDEFMAQAGVFGIADGVVILPKLREVGDGFLQGLSVQSVVFKSLEVAGDGFLQNAVVKTIGTPELRQVGENFMSENANKVEVMSAPKLENVPADFMQGNAAVRESIEEQRQAYLEEQQESEETRFRFIGTRGAENLDKAEEATTRLDNLGVAREMETAGKDAKAIKLATGWERGADGKWRYETDDDFEFDMNANVAFGKRRPGIMRMYNRWRELLHKKNALAFEGEALPADEGAEFESLSSDFNGTKLHNSRTLKDYIDAPELFEAYPEVADIKVSIEALNENEKGSYSPIGNIIRLNNKLGKGEMKSTLNHEIQHAIQYIEGFAVGGNVSSAATYLNLPLRLQRAYEIVAQMDEPTVEKIYEYTKRKDISIPDKVVMQKLFFSIRDGMVSFDDVLEATKNPYGVYKRLAGEVESRNVQKRMGMTAEARRNSLAEETYMNDVAKEDQIFIFDNLGVSAMMGSRVDARMAEVASHFDGKELSAEQRAVADVFGGKADNLTISVKTQDGNTRNVEMRQGNDLAGAKHSLYAHYGTTKGVINADDLLLIPDVIANGERTENGKKAVYKLDVNGTKYTVVTYVKQNKEEFHNFYSNKKGQPSQSVNASIGDTHSARITEELASADKGNTSSAEMQEGETLFRRAEQMGKDEVVLTGNAVAALGERANVPVRVVNDVESLPEKRKNKKGWFENGEVVVVLPNHVSMEDAMQTVLHEVVGRKGLRAVMGEEFDALLDVVYRNLPKDVKSRINYVVMTRFVTPRQATEEYIAGLARKNSQDAVLNDIMRRMGDYFRGAMNLEVEDGELRYMLWKNNQRKQTPNVISMVQDRVMEAETNTGDNGTRFRIANDTAKDAYEKNVRGWWNKVKEGHYDRLRSVRKAQEAIADETGMPISDSEDVYSYAEHLPSINKIMKEQFDNKFLTPFIKLLKRIYDVEFNGKKLDEKSVERYTNAKHGLERNRDMAVANALTTVEEVDGKKKPVFNKGAYEDWQTKKAAILAENITWEEKQDKLDALAMTYGAKLKDYSGLTAIFDPEGKMKYKQLRDEAIKYVTEMEGAIGKKSINELWKIVKGMTDFSLKQSYESGLLSKDMYESISKRYEFYVPLRGFTEETAEDYYDYLAADHTPLNSVIKRAEGRKSEADNIFATILNMANSAIVFGNKNRLKQRVLNLATRHKSSLLSVDRAWYEKKGEDVWELALPVTNENMTEEQLAQAYADFDADMKRKEALGEARRQVEGLNIKTRVISDQNKAQHAIRVKRNGREYIVWVNASPTMANAVNGMLREEETGWALSAIDAINKFRSKMVTQFSPTFVLTNLFRDVQSASTVYGVRYGAKALGQFEMNVMGNSVKMMGLYAKFKKGTLDENVPLERYFKEFLENGGETGYTEMISIEEYNKALNKLTEKLNIKNATGRALEAAGEGIEFANRCVENLCRFSAYMTSRENGISILQSVNDAKEVSVNFNRKGSGAMGAGVAKRLFMFYNPAVQALVQRYLLAKNYPKRMIPVLAGEFALGAMQPILFATISALASSAFGDDDDETWEEKFNRAMGRYYNLTDYRRRGSVCLPLGDGVFNPPLAHESRVFFGLGELAMSWYNGHETYDNIPAQAMDIIGQSLPLNPVEGWAQTGNLTESLLLNLTPDALKPFAENAVNRDFAGNKIHNASDMNDYLPEYMRGKKSTAEIYNRISKLLSGGESDFERGFLDKNASQLVNPSKLEHLVEGYLGGAYTFAEKLVRSASWAMGNEENADARNIPFVSSFYTPIGKYEEIPSAERTRRDWERAFDYYQGEMKLLDGKEKAAKRGLKFGMENAAETLEAMQGGEALMVDVFNDGNKILKELYADVDAARTAKDFDKVKEIDQEIYAQKRFITERMEQMVENPAMGYTFKTNKSEGAYGERETYGDVRDMNVINEFQKVLNPLIEEHKKQLEGKSEDEQYALYKKNEAMIEMYKTLKKKEQIVSNYKKAMESNPEKADEYMNNIRELRSEAVELINNYNE